VIYFIEAPDFGLVKVGKADRVGRRFREIRNAQVPGVRLVMIRVVEGDIDEEAELHRRWREWNVAGEWFAIEEIRSEIESITAVTLPEGYQRRACVEVVGKCGHMKRVADTPRNIRKATERPCPSCAAKEHGGDINGFEIGVAAVRLKSARIREGKRIDPWYGVHPESLAQAKARCVCTDCGCSLRLRRRKWYTNGARWNEPRRCLVCSQKRRPSRSYEPWWKSGIEARRQREEGAATRARLGEPRIRIGEDEVAVSYRGSL
jgi:hypothetical protein